MNESTNKLAQALEGLAGDIERNAGTVIGSSVRVEVGPGATGTVIGESISVSAGPGTTGNVIGKRVSVVVSGNPAQAALDLANEIRSAATAVRTGPVQPSRVLGLLDRASKLGNAALTAITRGAVEAAMHHYGV